MYSYPLERERERGGVCELFLEREREKKCGDEISAGGVGVSYAY